MTHVFLRNIKTLIFFSLIPSDYFLFPKIALAIFSLFSCLIISRQPLNRSCFLNHRTLCRPVCNHKELRYTVQKAALLVSFAVSHGLEHSGSHSFSWLLCRVSCFQYLGMCLNIPQFQLLMPPTSGKRLRRLQPCLARQQCSNRSTGSCCRVQSAGFAMTPLAAVS